MHGAIDKIAEGLQVILIFLGIASPILIICLFYYLKKRLEHKQIIATIEKGIPVQQLKLPSIPSADWIKNLTSGIALLIITVGIICIALLCRDDFDGFEDLFGYFIVALITFAIGISRLIRGLLQRTEKHKITKTENSQLD